MTIRSLSWQPSFSRGLTALLTVALCFGIGTSTAWSQETGFYSGGKFHKLIQSDSEYVVEFASESARLDAQNKMRASDAVSLENIPWAPSARKLAILRTNDAGYMAKARRNANNFQSINPVFRTEEDGAPILSSGKIVVRLRKNVSDAERDCLFTDYKVELVESVDGLANTYIVQPSGTLVSNELTTANCLYEDDRTVYAHPDFRFPTDLRQFYGAGDPYTSIQWYLENQGTIGDSVNDADIDLTDAWRRTRGEGILIGQLDDSCDVTHEDLAANYIGISHNTDGNQQSVNAAAPMNSGDRHGTSTMGLMVASRYNGVGITGIAPDAQWTASRGLEAALTTSQIASAYTFARNQNVDVHNNSWGFDGIPNPDVVVHAIETAFAEGRGGLGLFMCFAAGNGKGMFASDGSGVEVSDDDELATLSTVMGVGASNARDELCTYSNYGQQIDILAPSNDFPLDDANLPSIVTTDNTDASYAFEQGYNVDGRFLDTTGQFDLANPEYTQRFGGTSAATALVSGTAALILSLEPEFTAQGVRAIIEHTADKIDPDVANYNGITGRSLTHGYGRLNAGVAVEAVNDGYYWPERVANVRVEGQTILWDKNENWRTAGEGEYGVRTQSVLVAQASDPFNWSPTDGEYYYTGYTDIDPDTGVQFRIVANLDAELYNFGSSTGTLYFGIYSVTYTPKQYYTYGFGVSVDSAGSVTDNGELLEVEESNEDLPEGTERPSVSIEVTPLSGTSPLEVSFSGNAQSNVGIADGGFVWDFGDGSTAQSRNAEHTYVVQTTGQRFFATLTATDVNGATGSRSVAIDVYAANSTDPEEPGTGTARASIDIADPDSPSSELTSGYAPLTVLLSVDVSGVNLASSSIEAFWDLGDGNTGRGLNLTHSYEQAGRFPVSVTVTGSDLTNPLKDTRFVEVFANNTGVDPTPTPTPAPDPGSETGQLCGTGAATVGFLGMLGFALVRRFSR